MASRIEQQEALIRDMREQIANNKAHAELCEEFKEIRRENLDKHEEAMDEARADCHYHEVQSRWYQQQIEMYKKVFHYLNRKEECLKRKQAIPRIEDMLQRYMSTLEQSALEDFVAMG